MKKIFVYAVLGFVLAGCQPKEQSNTQETTAAADVAEQRKEAARRLTVQAMTMLGQKNYQGALGSLDAAIKFDPTNQDPYLILAQILLKAGEYTRASEFLDGAVKAFPDNGTLFYMMGIAHKMSGKKLPAVLAARRSFEIFKKANQAEDAEKAAVLLQQIINAPDTLDDNSLANTHSNAS